MTCSLDPRIDQYLRLVESGALVACADQHLLAAYVRRCFATEGIYTDSALLDKYLGLVRYFPFERLFPWEAFCIALHLCTFWEETRQPRWPDLLLLIGRGAGKDGFIAVESFCLASPYSGLQRYDVDSCANAEEQAMRPVIDLREVLEDARHTAKMRKHFFWTQEQIVGRKNHSSIRGRTNNPKSKDGMRSGIVIFNEIHQYQNYSNIKVFVTGQGKTMHPRRLYATTNGDVREGPLDELLARSELILKGETPDNGLLPFLCRLNSKEEAKDPRNWPMANPSLPYLPDLASTIEKEFVDWQANPVANADFMTKRMNLPQSETEVTVTSWDNIAATNRPLPGLTGRACVAGLDYASISDFASVNLHFREGEQRFDLSHSWLCLQSKDLHRLTIPWREWAAAGHLTLVDAVEIHPDFLCRWLLEQGQRYQIKRLAVDNYRYALLARSLREVGFDTSDFCNVQLVRPSDIMKTHPVIESAFANRHFTWGDNPPLRWATNNTKLVRASRTQGSDTGNYYYAKIEAKSRKTDPFMALVAAMTIESELDESAGSFDTLPLITL